MDITAKIAEELGIRCTSKYMQKKNAGKPILISRHFSFLIFILKHSMYCTADSAVVFRMGLSGFLSGLILL